MDKFYKYSLASRLRGLLHPHTHSKFTGLEKTDTVFWTELPDAHTVAKLVGVGDLIMSKKPIDFEKENYLAQIMQILRRWPSSQLADLLDEIQAFEASHETPPEDRPPEPPASD